MLKGGVLGERREAFKLARAQPESRRKGKRIIEKEEADDGGLIHY